MKWTEILKTGVTLVVLMLGLAACEREGPMERTGERADEAVEETKEEAREAKEKAEEAIK